jgi:pilus assembly protein CpaB
MVRSIILLIALGAGGLAAWLMLSARPQEAVVAEPAKPAMAEVLVAAGELAQGQILEEKNLRWQSWPKEAVSSGFITRESKPDGLTTLPGVIVHSHFVAGEPILESKLSRGASGMLAAMLPSGKRAVGISISAESTAGGFVLPNDRVDIIHNLSRTDGDNTREDLSHTLLRNIRVLAVDQSATETKGQTVVVGKTATLEVTPREAEIITAAQASGTLSLALRSIADVDETPARVQANSVNVRVFKGGKSESVKVMVEGASSSIIGEHERVSANDQLRIQ